MANETIGHIQCPIGGHTGEVRRYKTGKGKLYWVCECGMITPNLAAGQRYVMDNMKPITAETHNEETPAPVQPQKTAAKPVNEKTGAKTRNKSILDFLFSDDEA